MTLFVRLVSPERSLACPMYAAERDPASVTRAAEWLAYYYASVTSTYHDSAAGEQMVILDEPSKDGRTIACRYGGAQGGERPVMTELLNCGIR